MTDTLTPQEKMATIICRNHGHESAFIEPPCMVARSTADALIAEARASTDAELRALRQALEAVMNAPVFHSGIDHPALERANRLLRGSDR